MAGLVCHASQDSNSSLTGACTASDAWVDADEDAAFIQEDDSVPASLGQQSEADSEDVLDALIQHELTKFQQKQADKYAALLCEGQVVLPLPSPAPEQQQLRAQQKQQEALKDVASFEEVERIEYVPSARPTLDADHPRLQASSLYAYSKDQPQHSEEQQLQQPLEVSEPCTEVLHDGCHTWQAEMSTAAAAEPGLAAVTSTSGAGEEAVHAADEVSDMHTTGDDTPADAANAMQQQQLGCSISNTASPAASCQNIQAAAGKAQTAPAQAEESYGQQAEVCTGAVAAAAADPTAELLSTQCEPCMLAEALAPAGGVADCLAASSPGSNMHDDQIAAQQQQTELHLPQPLQQQQLGPTQPDTAGQSACDAAGCVQGTTSEGASQQPPECAATSQQPWQADSYSLAAHQQHMLEAEQQPLSPVEQQVPMLPHQEQQQQQLLLHSSCGELAPQRLASDDGSTQLLGCSGEPAASLGKDAAHQLPPQAEQQQQQQQRKEQQAAVEAAAPPSPPPDADAAADDVCWSPVEVAAGDVEESGIEEQAASAESPTPTSLVLQRQTAPEAAAAAAAAITAISLGSEGLSPWQAYTEVDCSSAQQGHTCSTKQQKWSGPAAAAATRQHSTYLSQEQSPRLQQQHAQQQQHGYRPRSGSSMMQRRPSPGCSRPSSAPAGSRRRPSIPVSPVPRVVPHSMHAGILGMVAESSQEGMCCSSRSSMQCQPGARRPCSGSNRLSSAAAAAEKHYQQQLLTHMQQLHLSRPTSADSWRSGQQPGRQQSPFDRQHRLQQLVRKPAPKWDDSPMPLHIPKTVPIAQATLLPSVTTAAAFAARCSAGSGSGRTMSSCAAGGGSSDLSRPQTAGPVMLHSSSAKASSQGIQQPAGSLTARSSSCSPDRRRHHLLLSSAGTTRCGSSSCSTHARLIGVAELAVAGQQCCDSSRRNSGGSSRGCGAADAYLLDVLQQIRQANSCCMQLGLCMQYRLAKGSSKRDKWQLEQIEVELWSQVTGSSSVQQQQQQPWQLLPGEEASLAAGASTWRLKRKLSLQQFTSHLSRLRGCSPASSITSGGASVSGPEACCLAGGQPKQPWPCTLPSAAGRRGLSPDRCQAHTFASSRTNSSSQASQVLDPASSNMPRSGGTAVGSCQLLMLSPRASSSNSSCTDHILCLVRPASAPRASSRLSPRRQQRL